jgi:hypothetical protein
MLKLETSLQSESLIRVQYHIIYLLSFFDNIIKIYL